MVNIDWYLFTQLYLKRMCVHFIVLTFHINCFYGRRKICKVLGYKCKKTQFTPQSGIGNLYVKV